MSTVDRQPRGNLRRREAPIGGLAAEWGERIDTTRSIGRGGKPTEPTTGPTEKERHMAVYESFSDLGGDADAQEIARHIQARWGFIVDEAEINTLRTRWKSLGKTDMVRRCGPPPQTEQPVEITDVDVPSEQNHSPDR